MKKQTVNPLRIAFIILVILSVVGNLVVPDILSVLNLDNGLDRDYGWEFEKVLPGFLNGLLIGEYLAIGFWLLLDTLSVTNKIFAGLSLGLLLAVSLLGGVQVWDSLPTSFGIFLVVVGGLWPLVFAVTLFCVAKLLDPGFLPGNGAMQATEPSKQFGIGYLMMLMVIIAILLSLIRFVLPWNQIAWFNLKECTGLGMWCLWLAIGTSVFSWLIFASVLRPTFFHIALSLGLAVFGPSIFYWVSSFFLVGFFSIRNPKWFEALPQSISFGVLAASLLIGVIVREFHNREQGTGDDRNVPIGTAEPLS